MPQQEMTFRDPASGREITLRGDSEPTEQELTQIFAQAEKDDPKSSAPVLDMNAQVGPAAPEWATRTPMASVKAFGKEASQGVRGFVPGVIDMVKHPWDTAISEYAKLKGLGRESLEAFSRGDIGEGAVRGVETFLPFIGPRVAEAGRIQQSGDTARGAGAFTDAILMAGAPHVVPKAVGALGETARRVSPGTMGPILNATEAVAGQAGKASQAVGELANQAVAYPANWTGRILNKTGEAAEKGGAVGAVVRGAAGFGGGGIPGAIAATTGPAILKATGRALERSGERLGGPKAKVREGTPEAKARDERAKAREQGQTVVEGAGQSSWSQAAEPDPVVAQRQAERQAQYEAAQTAQADAATADAFAKEQAAAREKGQTLAQGGQSSWSQRPSTPEETAAAQQRLATAEQEAARGTATREGDQTVVEGGQSRFSQRGPTPEETAAAEARRDAPTPDVPDSPFATGGTRPYEGPFQQEAAAADGGAAAVEDLLAPKAADEPLVAPKAEPSPDAIEKILTREEAKAAAEAGVDPRGRPTPDWMNEEPAPEPEPESAPEPEPRGPIGTEDALPSEPPKPKWLEQAEAEFAAEHAAQTAQTAPKAEAPADWTADLKPHEVRMLEEYRRQRTPEDRAAHYAKGNWKSREILDKFIASGEAGFERRPPP